MQVQQKPDFIETEGLENEQKKFEISNSRRMFEILSSNIYKDKPLAVIREYGCNAYDAHIAAGKADVPFEVHLPNQLEPWFSVKDFGIGLSHEDVMKLYTTYGLSTKNNENQSIGMLGLGSKSAFAYTDQFTITSIHGGKVRCYQAFKDKDGVPTITMLTEEATDEHPGLEIYIPAKASDFSTFANRAEQIFYRFPTLPNVIGNQINLMRVEYPLQGPNYKIRSNYSYHDDGAYAVQGTVAYPISSRSFASGLLSDLQEQVIDNLPVDIFFPIGQLDVTASREELNYDEFTQKNIIDAVDKVIEHLPNQFKDVLAECQTLWEAKRFYRQWTNDQTAYGRALMRMLGQQLEWNGVVIKDDYIKTDFTDKVPKQVPVMPQPAADGTPPDPNAPLQFTDVIEIVPWAEFQIFMESDLNPYKKAKPHFTSQPKVQCTTNTLFLFGDKKLRSPIKSIQNMFGEEWDTVIIIACAEDRQQDVISAFGSPPTEQIDWLSNHEEPAPEPREKKARNKTTVRKLLKVTGCNSGSFTAREADIDVSVGGKYVLLFNKCLLHPNGLGPVDPVQVPGMFDVFNMFQELGLLKGEKLYAFNSSHRRIAEKNPLWVNYYDEMEIKLNAMFTNQKLIRAFSFFWKLQDKASYYSERNKLKAYFKVLTTRQDKVLQSNSTFLKPWAWIRVYLNILNRELGTQMTAPQALNCAELFFSLNAQARKYWAELPEVTKDTNIKIFDVGPVIKHYPLMSKLLNNMGYSDHASERDILHYVNLVDAAPEISKQH